MNKRAIGEASARKAIQELELWAAEKTFSLKPHPSTEIQVVYEWPDLISEIDEKQALISSLQDSVYVQQAQHLVDAHKLWSQRLNDLDLSIDLLHKIQRKWLYLEPVIMGGAMPSETARFSVIDSQFRNAIMKNIESDSRLLSVLNISSSFQNLLEQLDSCQQALNSHLETKRKAEPRFYFIGDDSLLELLGQAQNPEIFKQHLKKLFAGIHSAKFNGNTMTHMLSAVDEQVSLEKNVQLVNTVEDTINDLGKSMKSSLKHLLSDYLRNGVENLTKPEQIVVTGERIFFSEKVENALQNSSLNELLTEISARLPRLTKEKTTSTYSLILEVIFQRTVVENLIKHQVTSVNDWNWSKQLRFYRDMTVRMFDTAVINYTFEYQGNSTAPFIHTPLTDKCYMTLCLALHQGLGGNPYGPAGTGKTETVKALGSSLGRHVLVFNCDEGIDVKSMSRIFLGLVECGAWGCFDEFNRLDEIVLSALSSDIQLIQEAVKTKRKYLKLPASKEEIKVDSNCAIFITMNPKGKGYGGRQKLPDNLKQLFRSVAMAKADNNIIAEVSLFTVFFQNLAHFRDRSGVYFRFV